MVRKAKRFRDAEVAPAHELEKRHGRRYVTAQAILDAEAQRALAEHMRRTGQTMSVAVRLAILRLDSVSDAEAAAHAAGVREGQRKERARLLEWARSS